MNKIKDFLKLCANHPSNMLSILIALILFGLVINSVISAFPEDSRIGYGFLYIFLPILVGLSLYFGAEDIPFENENIKCLIKNLGIEIIGAVIFYIFISYASKVFPILN